MATPIRRCSPTTPTAPGTGRRCCGTRRKRPGAPSALGAHREAAAQFERALRFADDLDKRALAALHEGVAGEYALLDRWEEARARAATPRSALRRELGDQPQIGEDLRRLSTTLWRLCRGEESGRAAEEAVQVLQALPPGPELAWAYATLGASYLNMGRVDEGMRRDRPGPGARRTPARAGAYELCPERDRAHRRGSR